MLTLGQSMKKCRERKGLSRQELSDMAKVPMWSIVAWEGDRSIPNVLSIIDLANALEITLDEYVGRPLQSFYNETDKLKGIIREVRNILDNV